MNSSRYLTILALSGVVLSVAALPALVISPAQAASQASSSALVKTAASHILVDANGRTLYVFAPDKKNKSTCYGGCAKLWPPLLVEKGQQPAAHVSGISAKFGTTKRKNGDRQLTFDGAPLYTFVGDKKPGDMKGQGLFANGGYWWAVAVSSGTATQQNSKATMDRLVVSITSTGGTVWGKVMLSYAANNKTVHETCAKAKCTFNVPDGSKVLLKESATDSTTWPFSKWKLHSSNGTKTESAKSLHVTMNGDTTVTAVYVIG